MSNYFYLFSPAQSNTVNFMVPVCWPAFSVVWELIKCLVKGCGDHYVNRHAPDSWPGPWGVLKMLPDCYTCQLLRERHRDFSERQTFWRQWHRDPAVELSLIRLGSVPTLAYPDYGRSCHSNKPTSGHSTVCMSIQTPPWAIIHWK